MALETRTELYSGQGRVSIARRTSLGRPNDDGFAFLGNCSKLMTQAEVEVVKHNESQTGKNAVDNRFEKTQEVMIESTFDEIIQEALERYLYGSTTDVAAATITAEPIKAKLGREVPTAQIPDTFTSLTDVGGATTYVLGTDYLISPTGMISFPATGSTITDGQDLEANYDAKPERITTAFTASNESFYLRFDGLNRASDDKPVVIEMYKTRFDPSSLEAINDEYAEYELNGDVLYDACNAEDDLYGGFMRIRVVE
ncbi:MAG: hypothetical protein QNJ72_14185 [Pleurocapsa sp. MO_226.B13]|nr:hypothetical protein [Pleurocapsa sp. MO_226.B13]